MRFKRISSSRGYVYGSLAAIVYGFSIPINKALLNEIKPLVLSGWFYLFSGLSLIWSFLKPLTAEKEPIKRKDIKIILLIIISGSILAPFLIFFGLSIVPAYQASLFLNFEVIFTIVIALIIFREKISRQVALGISIVVTILMLWSINFEFLKIFQNLSFGIIFILLGCLNYGIDNNLTKFLGNKSASRLVALKGICGGLFSLTLSYFLGFSLIFSLFHFLLILFVGVISYALSLILFIMALQSIGTIKTSIIFSTAPFLGSIFSVLFLAEPIKVIDFIVFVIALIGIFLIVTDKHIHYHTHGITIHRHNIEQDNIHHQNIIIFDKEKKSEQKQHIMRHIHKEETHKHIHSHENESHNHEHDKDTSNKAKFKEK
jgi:drug/metabolite transporter (DMT)-like permease